MTYHFLWCILKLQTRNHYKHYEGENDIEFYGSLTNRMLEESNASELKVGMGVTECMWSDRNAWEIVAIKDAKHITIRRMKATRKEGTDWYDQEYDLASDENGRTINLFKSSKGWRERIGRNGLGETKFSVGHAEEYRDPSF